MTLKWKVQPAPTGRHRSFEKRGWPRADYVNGDCAVMIYCNDNYYPSDAKAGTHSELTICVADHSVNPWRWRTLVKRAKTLAEAKELAVEFLKQHPEFVSKGNGR